MHLAVWGRMRSPQSGAMLQFMFQIVPQALGVRMEGYRWFAQVERGGLRLSERLDA